MATAEKYAGAFFVSAEDATRETLAHELCHVLGLLHMDYENAPNGDSSPAATRNLMHASPNYTYLYKWDSKRLREFQQIRMWTSKFLN